MSVSPDYTDMQVENDYLCSFLTICLPDSDAVSFTEPVTVSEFMVAAFATDAYDGSRSVEPCRKPLIFLGLFVILFPRALKNKRKFRTSEPLNAQPSTKSSHQIFKSINTVGGYWGLLKKNVPYLNTPVKTRLSETESELQMYSHSLALLWVILHT